MRFLSRERPSASMVVACVAFSFALAGTAVAGTDAVTSRLDKNEKKQVKRIAKKQANKEINAREASLNVNSAKTAATATNADNATNAANAANAGAVDGNVVRKVLLLRVPPVTDQQVLNVAGLQLDLTCAAGTEDLDATTTTPDSEISVTRQDAGGGAPTGVIADSFGPGDTVEVGQDTSDDVINLRFTGGDGRVAVAELVTDDDIGANSCVVSGFAIGG
jgi:hypothetical protein